MRQTFATLIQNADLLSDIPKPGRLGYLRMSEFLPQLPRRDPSQLGHFMFLEEQREALQGLRKLMYPRNVIRVLLEKRYLTQRIRLPSCTSWLPAILPSSPESIFIAHVRMSRSSFGKIASILTSRIAQRFSNRSNNKQLPVSTQLYISIHGLAFYGNAVSLGQTG